MVFPSFPLWVIPFFKAVQFPRTLRLPKCGPASVFALCRGRVVESASLRARMSKIFCKKSEKKNFFLGQNFHTNFLIRKCHVCTLFKTPFKSAFPSLRAFTVHTKMSKKHPGASRPRSDPSLACAAFSIQPCGFGSTGESRSGEASWILNPTPDL